jgi:hypothetical protein
MPFLLDIAQQHYHLEILNNISFSSYSDWNYSNKSEEQIIMFYPSGDYNTALPPTSPGKLIEPVSAIYK